MYIPQTVPDWTESPSQIRRRGLPMTLYPTILPSQSYHCSFIIKSRHVTSHISLLKTLLRIPPAVPRHEAGELDGDDGGKDRGEITAVLLEQVAPSGTVQTRPRGQRAPTWRHR